MPSIATWADIGVAVGTLALAGTTFKGLKLAQKAADAAIRSADETARLVEDGRQPVLLPDTSAPAQYSWREGERRCLYTLPLRNVGNGIAVLKHEGGGLLVDSLDPLWLEFPGSEIIGPAERRTVILIGSVAPVPVFTIRLTYADVRGRRFSRSEIPYATEGRVVARGDWQGVRPLHPEFVDEVPSSRLSDGSAASGNCVAAGGRRAAQGRG